MSRLEKILKKVTRTTLLLNALSLPVYADPVSESSSKEQKEEINPLDPVLLYKPLIEHVTQNNPEESALLAAIIYAESRGNPKAVSATNCVGLTQLSKGASKGIRVPDYHLFAEDCDLLENTCYILYQDKNGKIIKDNRDIPYPAIYGAYALLNQLTKTINKSFPRTSSHDKRKIKLLAYNAGLDTVFNAKSKTGKRSPSWKDLQLVLTQELIQESLGHFSYFSENTERATHKVKEIANFIKKVESYIPQFKPYFQKENSAPDRSAEFL